MASSINSSTPCWYCVHLGTLDAQTMIARCSKIGFGGTTHARLGCGQFERMPGVDDDLWEPKPPAFVPLPTPRRKGGRDGWWTEPPRPRRAPPSPAPAYQLPVWDPFPDEDDA